MPLLYTLAQWTVAPVVRALWQPEVEGREHVPDSGGAIFCSNHLSVADEFFLAAVIDRPIAFWAKEEYFQKTGLAGPLYRGLMHGLGAIPVHRAGGRAALHALDAAIPHLSGGGLVCIYPEGTRSPDGRLYRGRVGAARLAMAANVPIIPVGVTGTEKVQPVGQALPTIRPHEIAIRIGKPIDVSQWDTDRAVGAVARDITDTLMAAIQQLTGQEYVGRYLPPPDRP